MKFLVEPMQEMAAFEEAKALLANKEVNIGFSGLSDSSKLHMMYAISEGIRNKLIVTYSDLRAREIYEEYRFYDRMTLMYPAKDLIFYQADIHGNELTVERVKTLKRIVEGKPVTVVTTLDSLMTPQVPISIWKAHILKISKGSSLAEEKISARLVNMGYEKNYQVESPGQFSIRGGIIDIFDLTEENPYRIELWGDEIDSIRSFDILSQRSLDKLESISIYPATEMVLSSDDKLAGLSKIQEDCKKTAAKFREKRMPEEATRLEKQVAGFLEQVEFQAGANFDSYFHYFYDFQGSFLDYFDVEKTMVLLDEPVRIKEHAAAVELEFRESMMHRMEKGYLLPKQMDMLFGVEETAARMLFYKCISLAALDMKKPIIKAANKFDITAKSMSSYNNSFEALIKDLEKYKKNGYRIVILSASRSRAARLAKEIQERDIPAFFTENPMRVLKAGEIMTYYGSIHNGFEYPLIKLVVISESDIFAKEKKKKKKRPLYEGQKIQNFTDLKVGDYVVHEQYGLGVYKGIEKILVDKIAKDYMKIEYKGGDNLYVLATGFSVIQKYASADAKKPKLNKLGGKEWVNTKTKVRSAVDVVAKDLVRLYAIRQQKEGYPYSTDTVWQREFEEMFPFEETADQLTAIEETKRDMESTKIMDRLVCGDVGYGKTEVAIRAAFKAVQEGKQVVVLVPTTILAQQHYNTFSQRMKDFPIRVDLLSRFRTGTAAKKTLTDLQRGLVDIVIGTHRVLSDDVKFKDLGLLIVDEEQRFGVTHKEKIKQMKENVDVLTLTATPIPRTLHMSLIGIRDMSVLEEAPNDRMPIQTYVLEYNEEMVREAIVREMSRNGQVYYVYNRVNDIAEVAAGIAKLVPEANVAYAHGQMKESELEKIMLDFIEGEIDVLVSTTIIETGLDIPNVNTMIIHDSDNLGLSQLYQLRGRVGRSNRNAYAFLMYKRDKTLKEVAEKRLQAIKEFTDLGSGFKIAMRDLEIRGAGNLLGKVQHGHMEAVGYDLYCKMLNEAVKKEKGIETIEDFNTIVDLDVDAFIPNEYIMNEYQKLDIYKRIASCLTLAECDEMYDEMKDRFGNVPKSAENLLRISQIRLKAHKLYVVEIKGKNGEIRLLMHNGAKLKVENIPVLLQKHKKDLSFQASGTPTFTYKYVKTGIVEKDAENLLVYTSELLDEMEEILL